MKFEWNIKQQQADDVVECLLRNRGVTEKSEVSRFLNPDWERDTHDPFLFTQMQAAVERVWQAIQHGDTVMIHGDYDADGVCGSGLLVSAITKIQKQCGNTSADVNAFLPDRERDGYGVAMHNIEQFAKDGVDLIITVDCGISNADELDRAHELGMDVVICDHHQLGSRLPEHALIIHPLAPGETYPNKHLCGTGVAFKLASALFTYVRNRGVELPVGYEKWFLDYVAIATVTDVMPILGENRTLEKYGLVVLNKTRREGLKKIIELSRSELGSLDTQAIGYRIGPRINAAGRVRSAKIAFDALTAANAQEAGEYAQNLEMLNRERRRISDAAYTSAREIVSQRESGAPVHVVWEETWHPGIVGLVAGKLVTEFGVPSFALTRVGEHFVGSGRSIGGMHLVEAMRSCGDIFMKAGGHPQACGLTIKGRHLDDFRVGVEKFAKKFFGADDPKPTLNIDFVLPIQRVDWDLYNDLQKMAPFGEGNPHPVFASGPVQVIGADAVGKTKKHLRLTVNPKTGSPMKCIAFGFGDWAAKLSLGDIVELVYEIDVNEWQGKRELQCRVKDIKVGE